MRRRIDPQGRAALQAAYWAAGSQGLGGPVIFASRWGEVARSLVLLQQLAQEEPLSPTQFSLSVHNASAALYSMAREDRGSYLAVAAGDFSAEAGVHEAIGLLADGAPRAMLVCFDAPVPTAYAPSFPEELGGMMYAWACVLELSDDHGGIRLDPVPAVQMQASVAERRLPGDLSVLDFLIGQSVTLNRQGAQSGWRWTRKSS